MTEQEIKDWFEGLEAQITGLLAGLSRRLRTAEAALLRLFLADILPALESKDGKLTRAAGNLAKANLIERAFDELGSKTLRPQLARFSEELLSIAGRDAEYYLRMGFDAAKVKRIADDLTLIRAKLGLNATGGLASDGYLYRLGRSEALRQQMRDHLLQSIASGQSASQYAKGLKEIIEGSPDTDGLLTRYWQQHAFDAYSQVREIKNLQYADELGLNWFLYTGGIIRTTRRFCEKRNSKVFHRDDTKNWKNDPDLIEPSTKQSYQPLLERGRYNCRHFIAWLSDEDAKRRLNI